jgi:hypothetical protein
MFDKPKYWGKDLAIIYNTSPEHIDFSNELCQTASEIVSENTIVLQCNSQQLAELDIMGALSIEIFTLSAQDSLELKSFLRTNPLWIEARMTNLVRRIKVITTDDMVRRIERLKNVIKIWDGQRV